MSLIWWCGTSAVPAPGSDEWQCPDIQAKPYVECNCDMPHTLRCTGNKAAFKIISKLKDKLYFLRPVCNTLIIFRSGVTFSKCICSVVIRLHSTKC